jgi:hypothetical protein
MEGRDLLALLFPREFFIFLRLDIHRGEGFLEDTSLPFQPGMTAFSSYSVVKCGTRFSFLMVQASLFPLNVYNIPGESLRYLLGFQIPDLEGGNWQ